MTKPSGEGAADPKAKGSVVLVCHGLNLHPERMNPLCSAVQSLGLEPRPMTLHGHGPNAQPADLLTTPCLPTIWLSEMENALQNHGPALIGSLTYSLGSCCYLNALAQHFFKDPGSFREPPVHILLAPALAIRSWSRAISLLKGLPCLIIPSANPKQYRRHNGTPIAAYNALLSLIKDLEKAISMGFRLRNPVLWAINPRDELVSASKCQKLLGNLTEGPCQLLELDNKQASLRPRFAHLILDPVCLGDHGFDLLVENIRLQFQRQK